MWPKTMTSQRVPAALAAIFLLAAAAVAIVVVRACTGPGPTGPRPGRTSAVTSPFTGLAGRPRPVLAIKIDNVRPARPHTGLDQADIVYVEQVEAGQSRMLAVFSSHLPRAVGPVRSARESDLELLRQFGKPALAYSGAQGKLRPIIHAAPLYDLPQGRLPAAYYRGGGRAAPHNLYVRPERVLAAADGVSTAKDIGFRFGAAPPGGRTVSEHTVRYPAASLSFTWSAGQGRWLVSMDGTAAGTTDDGRLTAATVVVQRVAVHPSRFHDRWGSVSPYTETTGSGTALVLRDGQAFDARWSRPAPEDGTRFTTPSGAPMTFAPGPVWVVYEAR